MAIKSSDAEIAQDPMKPLLHPAVEMPAVLSAEGSVRRLLRWIGEDPNREGLLYTPARVIKALREMTVGYSQDPQEIMTTFTEGACDEMVILKDCEFISLCEHHILPFYGKISIGYIPKNRVIGISKLARMVEIYARRLQIQERLTAQIADAIDENLDPQGVMVVCEARHLCMIGRGIQKKESSMITSAIRGAFRENIETREEFLRLIR